MLALALAAAVHAADAPAVPVPSPDTWEAVRGAGVRHLERRRKAQTVAMSTLVGWSVANLGVGAAGWALAERPAWRHFHQMTVAWSGVNLAIGVPALVGALRDDPSRYDLGGLLRTSASDRLTYALNTGLDVGYVAAGAWLWERGERLDDPLLVGFGRAVVLQGGFLLLLDAVMTFWHAAEARRFMVLPEVGEALGLRLVVEL